MKRPAAWITIFLIVLAAVPQARAQQPPRRRSIISQIASGGGWKTTVTLANLSADTNVVTVVFRGNDGLPLELPVTVYEDIFSIGLVTSQVARTVPAFATLVIESEAPADSATLVGWADVTSNTAVAGYAILRQQGQDGGEAAATALLTTSNQPGLVLPFDNTDGYSTGIALVNPLTSRLAVRVLARDMLGQQFEARGFELPPLGHMSFILQDEFRPARARRGAVEVQSVGDGIVTGMGLRFGPSGNITSIPVVPIAAR